MKKQSVSRHISVKALCKKCVNVQQKVGSANQFSGDPCMAGRMSDGQKGKNDLRIRFAQISENDAYLEMFLPEKASEICKREKISVLHDFSGKFLAILLTRGNLSFKITNA